MTAEHYVVVHDPKGIFPDGEVMTATQVRAHQGRGIVFLPVDPTLYRSCGVGGYQKRAWGKGFDIGSPLPRMHAPLTLFGTPEHHKITWRAKIVKGVPNPAFTGILRISGDRGQPTPHYATVSNETSVLSMSMLGEPNDGDGWIIGGEAYVNLPLDGHYGFSLYGSGDGLRVAWAAASLIQR